MIDPNIGIAIVIIDPIVEVKLKFPAYSFRNALFHYFVNLI